MSTRKIGVALAIIGVAGALASVLVDVLGFGDGGIQARNNLCGSHPIKAADTALSQRFPKEAAVVVGNIHPRLRRPIERVDATFDVKRFIQFAAIKANIIAHFSVPQLVAS